MIGTIIFWAVVIAVVIVSCILTESIWPLRVLLWIVEAVLDSRSNRGGDGFSGGGGGDSGGGGAGRDF